MKVLVTGAAGFLGAAIVRALKATKHQIIAGCHHPEKAWRLSEIPEIITSFLDVTDPESTRKLLSEARPEAIIHCAAYGVSYGQQDVSTAFAVNVAGSEHLVHAAGDIGVRRFIQIGSCFEYGRAAGSLSETSPLRPTGVYGLSKAASSRLALLSSGISRLPFMLVRPFGLWGVGEEDQRLIPSILRACIEKREIDLTAGDQIRDYLYVDDAAAQIVELLTHSEFCRWDIINLGSGQSTSLRQFAQRVAAVMDGGHLLKFGRCSYRPDEMMSLVPDLTRLKALLPVSGPIENSVFTKHVRGAALAVQNQMSMELIP